MGRPAHQPDPKNRSIVEAMASFGMPEEVIAKVLRISPKTLRKHYRNELDTSAAKLLCKVANKLFKTALGDGPQATTAAIFIMKTRGRWRQASGNNHAGTPPISYEEALAQLE
jgi:hypothetical protein